MRLNIYKLKNNINKLDELRGTDFRATFPEMAYLLDEPDEKL